LEPQFLLLRIAHFAGRSRDRVLRVGEGSVLEGSLLRIPARSSSCRLPGPIGGGSGTETPPGLRNRLWRPRTQRHFDRRGRSGGVTFVPMLSCRGSRSLSDEDAATGLWGSLCRRSGEEALFVDLLVRRELCRRRRRRLRPSFASVRSEDFTAVVPGSALSGLRPRARDKFSSAKGRSAAAFSPKG
jgi:hypothetical protein